MTDSDRGASRAVALESTPENELFDSQGAIGRWGLFFGQWLKNPLAIGAIAPSSPGLARAVASLADPNKDGYVLELGGGTGAVTAALLETGLDPKKLVVVENNPALYRLLRQRFPRVKALQGDATRLEPLLKAADLWGPGRAQLVISGIPLLSMGSEVQGRVLRDSKSILSAGGGVAQFTYSWFVPLKRHVLKAAGLRPERTKVVWGNVPPASVWRFTND
ncbi:MAG: methyltransferase protein [Rhodospirillales bacterium]|nr:methyltransferase protein [Rhodospirillales bacterium]